MSDPKFIEPEQLERWFQRLDQLLFHYRAFWQLQPFHCCEMAWRDSHPQLCELLDALTDEEILELETDHIALINLLSPWLEDAKALAELAELPALEARELTLPPRTDYGIPGRKWQQILAFAGTVPQSQKPLLEWCAGKGHLGRVFALADQRSITSLEWQQSLCKDGEELAKRAHVDMQFVHCDAFSPQAAGYIASDNHAVALHACGDLHTSLMRHWSLQQGGRISVSPCCYHKLQGEAYQPMSISAQQGQLRLNKSDLKLPLQETVTAGAGVQRHRQTELLWRMAFDEWQRDVRGVDEYLPVPNVRKSLLTESFTEFVRWAAECKQLPVPTTLEEDRWLALGQQRLENVKRMELVMHLFRRPLELWLVLDRALYLQEQGARVALGEFCEKHLTPRNIFIHAERI
ncbi:methyltransferase [Maricurvus nonylphenolicus]